MSKYLILLIKTFGYEITTFQMRNEFDYCNGGIDPVWCTADPAPDISPFVMQKGF